MPKGKRQFHLMADVRKTAKNRGEISVYSAIGPFKWDEDDPTVTSNDFDRQLKALGAVDEITVRINSPGGVVSEAVAIRTALMKHPAKKTVDIEGCCDSAATLIACLPGARVRIAQGGEYMIHCCSAIAIGQSDKILSMYNSMVKTDNSMAEIYAERTGMSAEECMNLMKEETWYNAEEAVDAGFADEILCAESEDMAISACAVDSETWELMQEKYAHAPEHTVRIKKNPEEGDNSIVSSEDSAVAAERSEPPMDSAPDSTENTGKGEKSMPELKDATAEQLRQENPQLSEQIAKEAIAAERQRVSEINALTRKGEKWQAMAKKAIEDGTSAADYLKAIIAEETKTGEEYLNARRDDLAPADNIGAGDSKDNDRNAEKDAEEKADKAAREIAEYAREYAGKDSDGMF